MGLRINTNINALTAFRNLQVTDAQQRSSIEKLSSGLQIVRASDDPSGLTISEQLRAQVASLEQAVENSVNDRNLVSTTEAAFQEIADLLVDIRASMLFAMNTGGNSPEEIQAEQDAVDQAISAIKRISDTTRFASRNLLNGQSGFEITSQDTSGLLDVRPLAMQFDRTTTQTSLDVTVTAVASQAVLGTGGASGGDVRLRLTGPLGAEEIVLASGASGGNLSNAVNALRGNTGLYASGGQILTEDFGSDAVITLEVLDGPGAYTGSGGLTEGERTLDTGRDAEASLAGFNFQADGNNLSIVSTFFTGSIDLVSTAEGGTTGTYSFTVRNDTGLTFQLAAGATPNDQQVVGIQSLAPSFLGEEETTIGGITRGGFLTSIVSGEENDLFNDPRNGLRIVDAAIARVSDTRAFLGAVVADSIEPTIRSLGVAIENLTSSESQIRDLDFARETANLTRAQVLFQAGVSVLGQANQLPASVLQLLQ